jgi:hypothetical protein
MMQRCPLLLTFGLLALSAYNVAVGQAGSCPGSLGDTVPNAGEAGNGMAFGWRPADVARAVPQVLKSLGYRVESIDSARRSFVTRPGERFPKDLNPAFRQYRHPGVIVAVAIQPEADSTRLFVFARAVCAVDAAPPSGYTAKVEDTFELAAAIEVAFGIVEQLRRDHPRRL